MSRTLLARADKAEEAIERAKGGNEVPHQLLLPTRYTLDGPEEPPEGDLDLFDLPPLGGWTVVLVGLG